MKNPIAYLHKNNQEELNFPASEIWKRLFTLIKAVYADARYNQQFAVVVKKEIEALIHKVECLQNITKRIFLKRRLRNME